MDETRAVLDPAQAQADQAVFQRVWKRVMEGRTDGAESPILWEDPAGQPPAPCGEARALQPLAGQAGPQAGPPSDFPAGPAVVLGENCLDCVPLLQQMIRRELADWRAYQALARRAGGPQGRVLQTLANEEKARAKRLSAACFLISGVRYWPEGERPAPPRTYLGALRQRFGAEQAAMAGYLAGAEETEDPCLRQLFLQHAREAWDHACRIRQLVEQA